MTTARLSKRQSLSRTTVLFRTTFTRTIKHNLLLKWLLGSNLSHLVNSWETLPSFARLANRSSSLCSDDDHLYAIHHSKTPYRYHISTNQWQYVANLSALSNMRESSFCKKTAMVYNTPINVQPVGEGRAWGGDLTSFKNLQSNSLPTGKSFQSNTQNFLELISFIRVTTVREKSGENKNFSRSGKSQGTLFSGTMHQGWQWAFKGKIKPLWTFSTWWSFLFWK